MEKTEEFLMKPKIDYAFKELMMDGNVRRGFIAAVLGIDPEGIRETYIINAELRREHADEKQGILDVHVLMNDDTEIDIEINLAYMSFWGSRVVFYEAKMVTGQLHPGDRYDKLRKCISISVLDFKLFKKETGYYSCFHLWEDTRRFLLTDRVEFHVIELPKLPDLTKAFIESCDDPRMLWAEFIRAERREDLTMISRQNVYIGEAMERLEVISQDKQKQLEYLSREKAMRDHLQYEWEAEQRGIEQGRAEGRERGIAALVTTLKEMSLNKETVSKQLIKRFELSPEEAEAKTEQYWNG